MLGTGSTGLKMCSCQAIWPKGQAGCRPAGNQRIGQAAAGQYLGVLVDRKVRVAIDLPAHISPAHSENINFVGSIDVDIEGELAQLGPTGYRPLRVARHRLLADSVASVTGNRLPAAGAGRVRNAASNVAVCRMSRPRV